MNYLEMPEVSVAVSGMHVGMGGQPIVSRSRPGPDRNCGRRKHPLHAESGRSLPQQPSLRFQAKRCISGGAAGLATRTCGAQRLRPMRPSPYYATVLAVIRHFFFLCGTHASSCGSCGTLFSCGTTNQQWLSSLQCSKNTHGMLTPNGPVQATLFV